MVISGIRQNWATVGGMPRMIFLLQPNIEETLNPVRRPMQSGVPSRTLAWEKCRANINVRSTESDSFETASKTRSTYHEIMPNQRAICVLPRDVPQRFPRFWPRWADRVSKPWCAGKEGCTTRVSRLDNNGGAQPDDAVSEHVQLSYCSSGVELASNSPQMDRCSIETREFG